jgi:ABC-2 type transport system permease protein
MVSAWAKRVAFLWAVGPPLGLCVIEALAFHTAYLWSLLTYRLTGAYAEAFVAPKPGQAPISLDQLDPLKFLSRPGLWVGLLAAAIFLAAAVWLRRRRDPI